MSVSISWHPHGTAVLTLNRPEHRNPLDKQTVTALNQRLDEVLADETARAVIITGAPPAFSAGGDMRAYVELFDDRDAFRRLLEAVRHLFDRLEASRLVSIAAVNGDCVAGGFELTLACDLVVAGASARLGDGHLKYWQLPGGGGSQRLTRAVGAAVAKRLLYTHELLSAQEAKTLGLVSAVHPDAELIERALELARQATTPPEQTIVTMKRLLAVAGTEPLADGLGIEIDVLVDYVTQDDGPAKRGLRRFADR
jgi:enoyl-CoA hydratase